MDREGIDPDALEAAIQSHSVARQQWSPTPSRPYWAMLYLVPQFQNPTGVCLLPGCTYCIWRNVSLKYLFYF